MLTVATATPRWSYSNRVCNMYVVWYVVITEYVILSLWCILRWYNCKSPPESKPMLIAVELSHLDLKPIQ